MRIVTDDELAFVNGGGLLGEVLKIVGTWAAEKVLDAAYDAVVNGEVNDDTFSSPTAAANVYGA